MNPLAPPYDYKYLECGHYFLCDVPHGRGPFPRNWGLGAFSLRSLAKPRCPQCGGKKSQFMGALSK